MSCGMNTFLTVLRQRLEERDEAEFDAEFRPIMSYQETGKGFFAWMTTNQSFLSYWRNMLLVLIARKKSSQLMARRFYVANNVVFSSMHSWRSCYKNVFACCRCCQPRPPKNHTSHCRQWCACFGNCYGTTTSTSVSKQLSCRKGRALEAIPYTQAALLQHTKRAVYQAGHCWGQTPGQTTFAISNWMGLGVWCKWLATVLD